MSNSSLPRWIARPLAHTAAHWARLGPWLALAAALLLAAAPWLGVGTQAQRQIILVTVLALVVSGLNLSFGYAGELALGQVFMYATGAYVAGYLGTLGVTNAVVVLVAAMLAALVVGVVTGSAGLRLGGWMLALVSLLLLTVIPRIVNLLHDHLGGFAGMTGILRPTLGGPPLRNTGFYVLVIVCAALWFAALRNLVHSRYGTAFLVLKESPVLARTLGLSTYRIKLQAYALGAVPAGLAGALYAYHDGYIAPSVFTFQLGFVVLAASIVGGAQSVYGAILGAALLQLGPTRLTVFEEYAEIAYGVLLVLGGVLFRSGFAGLGRRLLAWALADGTASGTRPSAVREVSIPDLNGRVLEVEEITVRFGGFTALDRASLVARPGAVTALIGPNGSGKTTLLNVISGLLTPQGGRVRIGGENAIHSATSAARHGVARTFQTPLVPKELTVREVTASGRLPFRGATLIETVLRLPRYRRRRREDLAVADAALAAVGLTSLADTRASTLPLGTRRLLELARALAARPSVVLLDEIASGLDENELADLAVLIRAMRDAGATIVLVEHNFELVKEIADHVVVLADGAVLAAGPPEEIARHAEVTERYLGRRRSSQESETTL